MPDNQKFYDLFAEVYLETYGGGNPSDPEDNQERHSEAQREAIDAILERQRDELLTAGKLTEPDRVKHEEGVRVARAWSQWHLGSPSWAIDIINAYLNPGAVERRLNEEKS